MRPLSEMELLDVWDRGHDQSSIQRAITLLAEACPDTPREALAQLSIGQRDARLLTLREWTFGPRIVGIADCPACDERLEMEFDVAAVRVTTAPVPQPSGLHSLTVGGQDVRFRLPSSDDLSELPAGDDVGLVRRQLLERCLEQNDRPVPDAVLEAVAGRMAELDPQADIRLALDCPACAHSWKSLFDVASFFWSEINAWASRVLREVHTLASAYGWREADILAMSARRRQAYLDIAGA